MKVEVLYDGPAAPEYKTLGAAGCDLYADEHQIVLAGKTTIISTGLRLAIPEGYEGQVRSRSGLATKGVFVLNSPGCIDCFSGDSKISTLNGKMSIHDLRINDHIHSFNESTHEIESDIVTAIVDVGVRDVIIFRLDDNTTMSLTPGTLVYTSAGLKRADQLTSSDEILVDHDS